MDDEFTKEEIEYNKRPSAFDLNAIRIYEDKKVDDIIWRLNRLEKKVNKLISMLTAHDYATKGMNGNKNNWVKK
jgi:hypothetical protein